ncbi:MAG: hypothetical protein IT176_01010 [Acidobacteria bacterium]|nr:hypothetical protein [Acidobacteriota bacterium]
MSALASIRPDSWNLPLFLHVLGAMVLVGAAAVGSVSALAAAQGDQGVFLRRVSFRSFLIVALPAYIAMRIGAEWMYSKELGDGVDEPTWVGIGYITADVGAGLLLITLILSGIAVRRGSPGLSRAAGVVSLIAVIAWLVAVWAMGGKP